ncbi:type VII secretion protein EccB [Mycolicibacterium fortuitum]|uniref:Type VII secretion protein EccB n=1 Tax=Mycolicibacterium fortuitum TaxID=1766 RepID=A0A378UXB7_MYCFO|nr:type VII secretion protein EccB [Mycolicibacterium fortuitum]
MIHDPMRGQTRALIVGAVIAVLITGASAVMAFFKPTPNIGDAQIVLSKSSGAPFVRIGDQIHPVLNLASARLIIGKNDSPKQVDDKFLDAVPRGPWSASSVPPRASTTAMTWRCRRGQSATTC